MPKNEFSTSGLAEDFTRAMIQMACAETHLKTLYEKTIAEMENGMIDVENAEIRNAQIQKANDYREDLIETAQLRRRMMKKLFDLYGDGDKDAWCMVKHLAISNMCAWETWQASDDDPELLEIAYDSNRMLVKYLTRFLGMEITDCAACLSDMLKAEKE